MEKENIKSSDDWDKPQKKDLIDLAKINTKFIVFINPEIVEMLIKDNLKKFAKREKEFKKINKETSQCFWEKSSCVFPGARRKVGSKEKIRTLITEADDKSGLYRDDNDYPK